MSAAKQVIIRCDTEGCEENVTIEESRVWESRLAARAFGWGYKKEKDICPTHGDLL